MTSVLVIDDEDVLLDLLASLIADLGYKPLTATNGREALAVLESQRELPALIISDVMMPQMNGVVLAQRLREDARYRTVPLILMSAAGRHHPEDLADQFVAKPFDLEALEQLVRAYAGGAQRTLQAGRKGAGHG
jgi:CheY-like chemotaxis protein